MKLPTPAELLDAKRAGFLITVGLPGGRKATLTNFLDARRKAEAAAPGATFANAFNWWSMTREEVLAEFARGSMDRINLRAGIVYGKPMSDARVLANLKRTVKCDCNWCGRDLPEYVRKELRFCDGACRRDYNS